MRVHGAQVWPGRRARFSTRRPWRTVAYLLTCISVDRLTVELQRFSEAERAQASVEGDEEAERPERQTDNADLLEGDGGDEEDDHWEHDAAWVQAYLSAADEEDGVPEVAVASTEGEGGESAEQEGGGLQAHQTSRRRSWAPLLGGPSSINERDSTREDLFAKQLHELENGTMHERVIWKVPEYVREE